ncbi:OsmC family protein [Arthrobacter celericrescens]|uniref:OsmC family protein n=1 Tax=Arthrobacter celericrescens TaxID=2320851 RepID=UPI000EA318F7|nr:OsmC family protein [Arthrobacter celericrescens]
MEGSLHYSATVRWTGQFGPGYQEYSVDHDLELPPESKRARRGYRLNGGEMQINPAQLFLASLAQSHMLAFLSAAAEHGVIVTGYEDEASAWVLYERNGTGYFDSARFNPRVTVAEPRHIKWGDWLHSHARARSHLETSVNFPIEYKAVTRAEG